MASATYPKIELHVHVEQAVEARTLLEMGRRNDVALPASTVEGLAELMRFRDLASFIEMAGSTMRAFCTARDFADAVAEYARRAYEQGVVYLEVSVSPGVHARRGVAVDQVLSGACEGRRAGPAVRARSGGSRPATTPRSTPSAPRSTTCSRRSRRPTGSSSTATARGPRRGRTTSTTSAGSPGAPRRGRAADRGRLLPLRAERVYGGPELGPDRRRGRPRAPPQ